MCFAHKQRYVCSVLGDLRPEKMARILFLFYAPALVHVSVRSHQIENTNLTCCEFKRSHGCEYSCSAVKAKK